MNAESSIKIHDVRVRLSSGKKNGYSPVHQSKDPKGNTAVFMYLVGYLDNFKPA